MSPDEQEYRSICYTIPRIIITRLKSGRLAIGSGFNPPNLLHIAETTDEAIAFVTTLSREIAAQKKAAASHLPTIDIGDLF